MGYRLNCLDEPVLMAELKPMQTEFDIYHRLESCGPASNGLFKGFWVSFLDYVFFKIRAVCLSLNSGIRTVD